MELWEFEGDAEYTYTKRESGEAKGVKECQVWSTLMKLWNEKATYEGAVIQPML